MPMPKTIGHQVKFANTLAGLIRRGWWEIPEIMASSCMGAIGIILGIIGVYKYNLRNGDNKEYKSVYMIMRPNDPRVCFLNNPVHTKYRRF